MGLNIKLYIWYYTLVRHGCGDGAYSVLSGRT